MTAFVSITESGTKPRECGECTLCCRLLGVHELDKEPLIECKHCSASVGCKIYKERPNECKDFNCAWLLGETPEELKPSKSWVVLSDLKVDIERLGLEYAEDRKIVVVYVDPDHPKAHKTGKMELYLDQLLAKGVELIVVENGEKKYLKWGKITE
jgi:uncharacterized protein